MPGPRRPNVRSDLGFCVLWAYDSPVAEIGEGDRLDRNIRTVDDVLKLLDGLFARDADRWTADAAEWWDGFYADRDKPVPFFVAKPDENLVSYADRGLITPGRALDLGCGPGRNALHLASLGWEVDAIDLSPQAIPGRRTARGRRGQRGPGSGSTAPTPSPSPPPNWPNWVARTT